MSVHPMPRRPEPETVEDLESVYAALRARDVPADLALRAARAMYPDKRIAAAREQHPAPLVSPWQRNDILHPAPRPAPPATSPATPAYIDADGGLEWWHIAVLIAYAAYTALAWVVWICWIVLCFTTRTVWHILVYALGAALGVTVGLMFRR